MGAPDDQVRAPSGRKAMADTNEWMARYEEERRLRAALQPEVDAYNKAALLGALATAGIFRVEVDFDGYGDSGQIERIAVVDPGDLSLDAPRGEVEIRRVRHDGSGVESELKTLPSAIEQVCYDLLAAHHSGWENNDGAYGDFVFDVRTGAITYTHNSRYTEVDTSVHEL
jgi:hypothetical protein